MAEPGDAGEGGQQTGGGGVQTTLFTQEQVNSFVADGKRGALSTFFKGLGFDSVPDPEVVKSTFAAATEYQKLQDGKKDDLQKAQDELAAERQKSARAAELEVVTNRQKLAADAKVPSRFWKFLEGKTDEEINQSIKELKEELGLQDDSDSGGDSGQGGQQQQSGTGRRPPNPNEQQGRNNGGGAPGSTLAAGREAYEAKHNKGKKE